MKDFDNIHKLMKENKQIKHGLRMYIEMISSNPNKTDMLNDIDAFMEDRRTMKNLFKQNLKDPANIERMKKDNFTCSLKIANYGRREMWMPDKVNFNPAKAKHKASLVQFDKDGKAWYPDKGYDEEESWNYKNLIKE